jgi:diguanylate cyclase (GGDEF)-like protein
VLAQLLVHTDDAGSFEFYSGVMHDISERKRFESELAHQATHDALTGLPNRVLLLDRLEQALQRARRHHKRVAVLFLDLDRFKVVNDSLGHSVGDRLLVSIAERLGTVVRPGDTIARFGGDEFVVLCEDLETQADAVAVAERVNAVISGPFEIDDAEVFVGVSIGIAFPDDIEAEAGTLIRDADAAMYRAKERGRARYEVFDNQMRASAVDRLDIENALRRAQERRELRVFYQPIISLDTGAITGVEALIRWEHPERGLLNPIEFIQIAEETGLIVPMGAWVLDHACRQIMRWQAQIPDLGPLKISVNLSGRQLGHPNLVADVKAIITETHINPSQVELEITESVLMDDVEMSEDTLGQLKKLGVKLVVDDFGTGYSSLSYLRRFPVDVLKVDRSFVDGLGTDPSDSAIVTAIITLAHTLGLRAVAEGVETDTQLAELRNLSCDMARGLPHGPSERQRHRRGAGPVPDLVNRPTGDRRTGDGGPRGADRRGGLTALLQRVGIPIGRRGRRSGVEVSGRRRRRRGCPWCRCGGRRGLAWSINCWNWAIVIAAGAGEHLAVGPDCHEYGNPVTPGGRGGVLLAVGDGPDRPALLDQPLAGGEVRAGLVAAGGHGVQVDAGRHPFLARYAETKPPSGSGTPVARNMTTFGVPLAGMVSASPVELLALISGTA